MEPGDRQATLDQEAHQDCPALEARKAAVESQAALDTQAPPEPRDPRANAAPPALKVSQVGREQRVPVDRQALRVNVARRATKDARVPLERQALQGPRVQEDPWVNPALVGPRASPELTVVQEAPDRWAKRVNRDCPARRAPQVLQVRWAMQGNKDLMGNKALLDRMGPRASPDWTVSQEIAGLMALAALMALMGPWDRVASVEDLDRRDLLGRLAPLAHKGTRLSVTATAVGTAMWAMVLLTMELLQKYRTKDQVRARAALSADSNRNILQY